MERGCTPPVKEMRQALLDGIEEQLLNHGVVDKLGWLNVDEWPQLDTPRSHVQLTLSSKLSTGKGAFQNYHGHLYGLFEGGSL